MIIVLAIILGSATSTTALPSVEAFASIHRHPYYAVKPTTNILAAAATSTSITKSTDVSYPPTYQ
jgi:hypothetical protein